MIETEDTPTWDKPKAQTQVNIVSNWMKQQASKWKKTERNWTRQMCWFEGGNKKTNRTSTDRKTEKRWDVPCRKYEHGDQRLEKKVQRGDGRKPRIQTMNKNTWNSDWQIWNCLQTFHERELQVRPQSRNLSRERPTSRKSRQRTN